jgi:peptidoglycan/LPS O-acetylase OafA/YrhL
MSNEAAAEVSVADGAGTPAQLDEQRYLPSGDEAGTAPADRAFRPDVEGLRAVAILLVVLVHAGVPHMQGGTVGVDAFFVISGFVITGLLLREHSATGGIGFLGFYARRARRILPMALLVIVVAVLAIGLLASHRDAIAAASDGRWSALFLSNVHFASVDPNVLVPRQSPFGQYWSLAVEEQFYLVYPAFFVLLLLAPGRWSLARRLALGLTGVAIASFVASAVTSDTGQLAAYYSPFSRAWELAVGGLVALGTPYLKRIPAAVAAPMTWLGLAGLVIAADLITVTTPYPGYAAALPVLSVALIIAGGTVIPPWGAEVLLGSAPFRWIGRWSYSWYLWHLAIIVIAAEYAHELYGSLSVELRLFLSILALIVAALSYFLVENPIRHSDRIARSPGAVVVGAGLLVGSCIAFTFAF